MGVSEQIGLKSCKLLAFLESVRSAILTHNDIIQYVHLLITRHSHKRLHSLLGESEQLVLLRLCEAYLRRIYRKYKYHALNACHELPDKIHLYRCKSCESVKIQMAVCQHIRPVHAFSQQFNELLRNYIAAIPVVLLKSLIYKPDVMHFSVYQTVLIQLVHDCVDRIPVNRILEQLRHHGFHLIYKTHLVDIASINKKLVL